MQRNEEREQARLIKWASRATVRAQLPALSWLFHVPNGGQRSARTGAQLRAMGVRPGVPDLLLPQWQGGIAIEMKSPTGRLAPEQASWLAHLDACGWRTVVARSAEEARLALIAYLGGDPAQVPGLDA